jgi:hypothetical protein
LDSRVRVGGGRPYLDQIKQDFRMSTRKYQSVDQRTDIFAFKCSFVLVLILRMTKCGTSGEKGAEGSPESAEFKGSRRNL